MCDGGFMFRLEQLRCLDACVLCEQGQKFRCWLNVSPLECSHSTLVSTQSAGESRGGHFEKGLQRSFSTSSNG
jgi:hypothetical protein